ncbi:MAG: aminoacetone oxidase family FAD-binding enzyme, partial [Candidatus Spechtbacteria bacterium]|nr:aminoacetone oxidase family FAD-binding enzyme [Candidatus Spechtbacteria bacterium]
MEQYIKKNGVIVKTGTPVSRILSNGNQIAGVLAGGAEYTCDAVILASGGMSHPETGSTGDGFKWLEGLGHTVRKPTPGIVPLAAKEEWIKNLAGVTLSPVKITFFLNGTKRFSKNGEILCTHFGLSGPMILNCAGLVGDLLHEGKVTIEIDVVLDMNLGELENKIIALCDANKNKTIRNILKDITPRGTAGRLLPLMGKIDGDTKAHSVTREQRKLITRTLKALPLTITGLMGYERAVVVDGGVILTEIDTRTMGSRLYRNLYVTGDLLDISRPSGGYSLQLCWTTGYVAGSHAQADSA